MKNPTYPETVARNHARNAELTARREREWLQVLCRCELTAEESRSLVLVDPEPILICSSAETEG